MTTLSERVYEKVKVLDMLISLRDDTEKCLSRLDRQNSRVANIEIWRYAVDNELDQVKTFIRGFQRSNQV